MKKFNTKSIVLLVVIVLVLTLLSALTLFTMVKMSKINCDSPQEHLGKVRTMEYVVIAQDNHVLTLEDETHSLWVILNKEMRKGDVAIVWLDDMNTNKDLTDDEILKIIPLEVD